MSEGETLLMLVEHDLAISRAEKLLEELPEKRAVLRFRKRLREIESVLAKAEAYCRKTEALISKSNDEAALVQAKIDSEQAKVLSGDVTNPKELQNLTRELDALKRKKDAIEHGELALMEKAEAGSAQISKIRETLEDGAAKERTLIEEFKVAGGKLQTEIMRHKEARASAAASLPAELLRRYESLREAKHGIAAGELKGDLCTACRTSIPAQEAQAIQAGPEIAECPNCRRMLVVGRES